MTDRELLESAAKAAGLAFEWNSCAGCIEYIPKGGGSYRKWRPLSDDGDAFRLMASLSMEVTAEHCLDDVTAYTSTSHASEAKGEDALAATRRAIVAAAAMSAKQPK